MQIGSHELAIGNSKLCSSHSKWEVLIVGFHESYKFALTLTLFACFKKKLRRRGKVRFQQQDYSPVELNSYLEKILAVES